MDLTQSGSPRKFWSFYNTFYQYGELLLVYVSPIIFISFLRRSNAFTSPNIAVLKKQRSEEEVQRKKYQENPIQHMKILRLTTSMAVYWSQQPYHHQKTMVHLRNYPWNRVFLLLWKIHYTILWLWVCKSI